MQGSWPARRRCLGALVIRWPRRLWVPLCRSSNLRQFPQSSIRCRRPAPAMNVRFRAVRSAHWMTAMGRQLPKAAPGSGRSRWWPGGESFKCVDRQG